jgi:hypothetical protein
MSAGGRIARGFVNRDDLSFSIAFPFDDDCWGMAKESIQKGGGEHIYENNLNIFQ